MKRIIVILTAIILSGCASNQIKNDYSFAENTEKGVLIGSISFDGPHASYGMVFKNKNTGNIDRVMVGDAVLLIPKIPKTELVEYGTKGEIFALELDPGTYSFIGWGIDSSTHIHSTQPFSIDVQVKPGVANYVGNFHFKILKQFGLAPTEAIVEFSNKYNRDSQVFKRKYPNLPTVIEPVNIVGTHNLGYESGYDNLVLDFIDILL